jgi:hypothetical protein
MVFPFAASMETAATQASSRLLLLAVGTEQLVIRIDLDKSPTS